MKCLLAAAGALAILVGTSLAAAPAYAQYGYGGYGRSAPDDDDDYDRPRRRGGEYIERREYREGYDRSRRRDDDDFDRPRRRGDDVSAPPARGGFSRSCFDIEQNGPYLSATCRRIGGGSSRSRIDVRSCRSIGNNDGRLVCE